MKLSELELIVLLFALFGISTIHASIGGITSPLEQSSYLYNATIPVEIDYGQLEIIQVEVNQTCGTDIYTYLFVRPTTQHDFPLPGTYTGTCVYTSMTNILIFYACYNLFCWCYYYQYSRFKTRFFLLARCNRSFGHTRLLHWNRIC